MSNGERQMTNGGNRLFLPFFSLNSNTKRQRTLIIHSSIAQLSPSLFVLCKSTFNIPLGTLPKKSNASGSSIEPDGDLFPFNNDGYLADTFGIFQHGVEIVGVGCHIKIVHLPLFYGECFPSCPGVGSSILSEY